MTRIPKIGDWIRDPRWSPDETFYKVVGIADGYVRVEFHALGGTSTSIYKLNNDWEFKDTVKPTSGFGKFMKDKGL